MRLVKSLLPYRPNEINGEALEKSYANGGWGPLGQIDELGRYSLIAGYTQYVKEDGIIPDVGCGEGILQQRLDGSKNSRYVGIDISSVAIERANANGTVRSTFMVSSIGSFDTEEGFDVIIFNECLYYLQDSLGYSRNTSIF